jgi:hypothetical protein
MAQKNSPKKLRQKDFASAHLISPADRADKPASDPLAELDATSKRWDLDVPIGILYCYYYSQFTGDGALAEMPQKERETSLAEIKTAIRILGVLNYKTTL